MQCWLSSDDPQDGFLFVASAVLATIAPSAPKKPGFKDGKQTFRMEQR
jgi:hypothetical protein